MAILKYFLKNEDFKSIPWIVIADDDTLLNVNQLQRVISCLPTSEKIILGERYGFGYEWDGLAGYDYPTGGSGFVLSREAARILAYNCDCPTPDSPDDMIIGACARRSNTPILHSSAFHQAQRRDYDPLFIQRITPISFHKFEGIDPYKEYADYLLEKPASSSHTEL
jgi:UDP-glucose:O-linked fucose beta-1,3-glucosyltransferase